MLGIFYVSADKLKRTLIADQRIGKKESVKHASLKTMCTRDSLCIKIGHIFLKE